METNKEKSKCWCVCPVNFGSAHCNCTCHKPLEPQVDNQQNQCDGCLSGMQLIEGCHFSPEGFIYSYCSKDRYVDNQQKIREEFIKHYATKGIIKTLVDMGVSEDTGKYMFGKITDWWLDKLSQAIEQERERVLAMVLKEIEGMRKSAENVRIIQNEPQSNQYIHLCDHLDTLKNKLKAKQ